MLRSQLEARKRFFSAELAEEALAKQAEDQFSRYFIAEADKVIAANVAAAAAAVFQPPPPLPPRVTNLRDPVPEDD